MSQVQESKTLVDQAERAIYAARKLNEELNAMAGELSPEELKTQRKAASLAVDDALEQHKTAVKLGGLQMREEPRAQHTHPQRER